jgi:signal peptidase II
MDPLTEEKGFHIPFLGRARLRGRFLLLLLTVTFLDQLTKYIVVASLTLHQRIELVPSLLNLTYTRNPGVAFGLLSRDGGETLGTLLLIFSFVATCVILLLWLSSQSSGGILPTGLTLILGGAVGNLIDRLRMGEVVDFIDLHWGDLHWPAFNLADSAITVGAFMVLFRMLPSSNNGRSHK